MKKGIIALIGMIVALVFIIVAFVGPWYGGTSSGVSVNFYLTRLESAGVSMGYDNPSVAIFMSDIKNIFDNTMYLTMGALVTAILALIGMLGFVFNFGKSNMMRMLGAIFGIITFVLALAATIYFMNALTGKMTGLTGFWNEEAGPGYAWYLMLVATIIALIASIAMFLKKSDPEVVAQPPQ